MMSNTQFKHPSFAKGKDHFLRHLGGGRWFIQSLGRERKSTSVLDGSHCACRDSVMADFQAAQHSELVRCSSSHCQLNGT